MEMETNLEKISDAYGTRQTEDKGVDGFIIFRPIYKKRGSVFGMGDASENCNQIYDLRFI
jgi:hypothetical protein